MTQEIYKPIDGYDVVKFAKLTRPMEVRIQVYATLRVLAEDNKETVIPSSTTAHHSVICKNEYSLTYHGDTVGTYDDYTPSSDLSTDWSFEILSEETGLNIFLQTAVEDGETKLYLCANADVVNKMIFNTVNAGATCNVLPVSGATFADLKIIRNDTTCLRPTPRHSVSSVEWNDGFPISNQNN